MESNQSYSDEAPATNSSLRNDFRFVEPDLLSESDRLRTFEYWTVPFIDKKKLASAGFYYLNVGDHVKCPVCKIEVGFWRPNDDPLTEHETHSPRCEFVKKHKSPPRSHDDTEYEYVAPDDVGPRSVSGEDTCGLFGIENRRRSSSVLDILSPETVHDRLSVNSTDTPRYPAYLNYTNRLKSYYSWSPELPLSPEALSEAGFFYTGEGDRAVCFHCGGALHHWDPTDDPWVEHAVWFSTCKYVMSVKGQEFIDEVLREKHVGLAHTQEEILSAVETFEEFVCDVGKNKIKNKHSSNASSSEETGRYESESTSSQNSSEAESKMNAESRLTCLICMEAERDSILLPCYHMVVCQRCASKLTKCCFCRETVSCRRRVYIP